MVLAAGHHRLLRLSRLVSARAVVCPDVGLVVCRFRLLHCYDDVLRRRPELGPALPDARLRPRLAARARRRRPTAPTVGRRVARTGVRRAGRRAERRSAETLYRTRAELGIFSGRPLGVFSARLFATAGAPATGARDCRLLGAGATKVLARPAADPARDRRSRRRSAAGSPPILGLELAASLVDQPAALARPRATGRFGRDIVAVAVAGGRGRCRA